MTGVSSPGWLSSRVHRSCAHPAAPEFCLQPADRRSVATVYPAGTMLYRLHDRRTPNIADVDDPVEKVPPSARWRRSTVSSRRRRLPNGSCDFPRGRQTSPSTISSPLCCPKGPEQPLDTTDRSDCGSWTAGLPGRFKADTLASAVDRPVAQKDFSAPGDPCPAPNRRIARHDPADPIPPHRHQRNPRAHPGPLPPPFGPCMAATHHDHVEMFHVKHSLLADTKVEKISSSRFSTSTRPTSTSRARPACRKSSATSSAPAPLTRISGLFQSLNRRIHRITVPRPGHNTRPGNPCSQLRYRHLRHQLIHALPCPPRDPAPGRSPFPRTTISPDNGAIISLRSAQQEHPQIRPCRPPRARPPQSPRPGLRLPATPPCPAASPATHRGPSSPSITSQGRPRHLRGDRRLPPCQRIQQRRLPAFGAPRISHLEPVPHSAPLRRILNPPASNSQSIRQSIKNFRRHIHRHILIRVLIVALTTLP